jgi:hypothetical protein
MAMTDTKRQAFIEWLRDFNREPPARDTAADQIEADGQRIAELEAALVKASRDIQGYKDALAQVGEFR